MAPKKRISKNTENKNDGETKAKKQKTDSLVHEDRVRQLKQADTLGQGPVLYWMTREMRSKDNWNLIYAAEMANKLNVGLAIVFVLLSEFNNAGQRQFMFMIKGVAEIQPKLAKKNIEFLFYRGNPIKSVSDAVKKEKASLLIFDFFPVKPVTLWYEQIVENVECEVHQVDGHNIVPCWRASEKRETGARTIRNKIHKLLPEFLTEFPECPSVKKWEGSKADKVDWPKILQEVKERGGKDVPEVHWIKPGEDAGYDQLLNEKTGFLSSNRLKGYSARRNIPGDKKGLSNISPWLHFGQLSAQRAAMEAKKKRSVDPESVDSFFEEMVVRRELSDNFCFYEPNYDNLKACADWAKISLKAHLKDKREYIYTRDQFEKAETHDDLWNTAQMEMVKLGKMHGYVRMYWAKKFLEWTKTPEDALAYSIYLNDKYELDGRDPNGYVGCMWSIGGIHDQGWGERAIFGKVRFMNYNGCKKKFSIQEYKDKTQQQIEQEEKLK